jgi:hypothetical protein
VWRFQLRKQLIHGSKCEELALSIFFTHEQTWIGASGTAMQGTKSLRNHSFAGAVKNSVPALGLRLQYKFQSSAVVERCTSLAVRMFLATGAAGLSDELPFGAVHADLMVARQHISNQYDYYGGNWGGVMFGQENQDLLL